MTVYSAYFDTAGTEHEGERYPVLVTVGALAPVDAWSALDRAWLAALRAQGIGSFHMHECAHWSGPFATWSRDEARRRALLSELVDIAATSGLTRVFVRGVVLSDYAAADSAFELTETVGGPYSVGQAACLLQLMTWLHGNCDPEQTGMSALVEKGDAGQSAFRTFAAEKIGWSPDFVDRVDHSTGEDVTPLSVADLVAYEHRLLYNKAAAARLMPAKADWRGLLSAVRDRLPIDGGILEAKFFDHFCRTLEIPRRKAEASRGESSR